jgi:Histidine kinase-, DNA gyrase B-, and HSP90-like ATPase
LKQRFFCGGSQLLPRCKWHAIHPAWLTAKNRLVVMTYDISLTSLWRKAFIETRTDSSKDEQAFFRQNLEEMREHVKPLVARIMRDMPGYTVHDITHLDALWETASLVATDDLALSPPEAFVFGGAVLLHDAAMTLAAYPGGLANLKTTPEWADAIALRKDQSSVCGPSAAFENESEKQVAVDVLRRLHARKAKDLATQAWPAHANVEQFYLIENYELRHHYGKTIGTIANSHWWPITKVERELGGYLGGMTPKTQLSVDQLKIACLLRVADVLHLDRRRAPPFVRALERPGGISALHWAFQSKLGFPYLEDDAAVFTAGEPCTIEEAESWWCAFDAFGLADRELRDVDRLLRDQRRRGLRARCVKGANNPDELVRLVPVSGWRPVETLVHISDIPRIVEMFGGTSLYGEDPTVPIRELLQNAMDAVQARRRLQDRTDWGLIRVELSSRKDGVWLSVEDNGVGMSERVLTGALLDFGVSFWRSARVTEEFPTLAARGMNAIGRFGIGFFSVFMLGEEVRVTTRRYDRGETESLMLAFRAGLGSRPILSPAVRGSAPLDGGTRIEIRLQWDPRKRGGIRLLPKDWQPRGRTDHGPDDWEKAHGFGFPGRPYTFRSLAHVIAWLAPASDISIDAVEFGQTTRAVNADDWRTVPPAVIAQRVAVSRREWGWVFTRVDRNEAEMMRPIIGPDEAVYGRAAVLPERGAGVLTAGGLRVQSIRHLLGIVSGGEVQTAARDRGRLTMPPDALAAWASEQGKLLEEAAVSADQKAQRLSSTVVEQLATFPSRLAVTRG